MALARLDLRSDFSGQIGMMKLFPTVALSTWILMVLISAVPGLVLRLSANSVQTAPKQRRNNGTGGTVLTNWVLKPALVVPGDWMTDPAGIFILLPLSVPNSISLQQCKVLCNGESLLIVVPDWPRDEPESDALQKYKLVMEAFKSQVGHNDLMMKSKLQQWLDIEEDSEVRVHIQAALESLSGVIAAKLKPPPRRVVVPLGPPKSTQHAQRASSSTSGTSIIRESFSVDIPFPAPQETVFALHAGSDKLFVIMPLFRTSLKARGISTARKPFSRVPVFEEVGQLIAGPKSNFTKLAAGLDIHALLGHGSSLLAPLQAV